MSGVLKSCISDMDADGFPNIVDEPSLSGRLLWFSLVLSSLTTFLYHSSVLISQYVNQQVAVNLQPNAVPFIQPDILICPKKPFAIDYLYNPAGSDLLIMSRVSNEIRNINSILAKSPNLQSYDKNIFLWNSVNLTVLYKALFHRQNELFLQMSCNGLTNLNVKFEMNWHYLGCWRITPDMCQLSSPWASLKLILYIHMYNTRNSTANPSTIKFGNFPIEMLKFNSIIDYYVTDSVVIYFLPRSGNIDYSSTAVSLMGGRSADIRITAVINEHKNRSSYNCVSEKTEYKVYDILQPGNILSFNDTYTCMCVLSQRQFYSQFKCVVANYHIPIDIPPNVSYCFNLSRMTNDMVNVLNVYLSNVIQASARNNCSAQLQCTTIDYGSNLNYMNWPLPVVFRRFLETELPMKILSDNLSGLYNPGLVEMVQDLKNPSGSKLRLWKDNVYHIVIIPGEHNSSRYEESITHSFTNVLADIGGILGFYTGASLLTLCEFFNIIHDYFFLGFLSWRLKIKHIRI